jgi:hypothetical protein
MKFAEVKMASFSIAEMYGGQNDQFQGVVDD